MLWRLVELHETGIGQHRAFGLFIQYFRRRAGKELPHCLSQVHFDKLSTLWITRVEEIRDYINRMFRRHLRSWFGWQKLFFKPDQSRFDSDSFWVLVDRRCISLSEFWALSLSYKALGKSLSPWIHFIIRRENMHRRFRCHGECRRKKVHLIIRKGRG